VKVIKHRRSDNRHLYFVTFDGTHPAFGETTLSFHYIYAVEQDSEGDGWRVRGAAGGAGDPPRRATPWVNLGGGGWPDRFFAGGWIDPADREIDRNELRFANGLMIHDDATEGVALFINDEHVVMPATVVMIDAAGTEIARHSTFPGP
jgi:hypothetical protein